jgi:hypothetical protein
VGDERRPFDDRQVAAELLAHRLGAPVADDDGPRER